VPAEDEPKPVDEAAPKEDAPETAETAPKPRKATAPLVGVTFKTDPEGARVATRTHVYGTTPQPAKLSPGTTYELTFTKAGYVPLSKKYVAPPAAKGPTTLRVSLKKLPEPGKTTGRSPRRSQRRRSRLLDAEEVLVLALGVASEPNHPAQMATARRDVAGDP